MPPMLLSLLFQSAVDTVKSARKARGGGQNCLTGCSWVLNESASVTRISRFIEAFVVDSASGPISCIRFSMLVVSIFPALGPCWSSHSHVIAAEVSPGVDGIVWRFLRASSKAVYVHLILNGSGDADIWPLLSPPRAVGVPSRPVRYTITQVSKQLAGNFESGLF